MINIVTGYKGVKHVTSEQFADLNRSIFGNGNYILKNIGDGCNYNIVTNNEIQIQSGVFFIQGKQGEIDSGGISATIENGTQGMKRYDVICIKYTKDSISNIENFEYETIKGTEDPNEYIIPEFDRGDIRAGDYEARSGIYGVKINGLAIESVELFSDIEIIPAFTDKTADLLFEGAVPPEENAVITLSESMKSYKILVFLIHQNSTGIPFGYGFYPVIDQTQVPGFTGQSVLCVDGVPYETNNVNTISIYSGRFENISNTQIKTIVPIHNILLRQGLPIGGASEYYIRQIWGIR